MIVQPCSRVLVPLQGMPIMISLSFFVGNEAATQVEDGNFRLSPRSLGHRPVTLPPTNQKTVIHPATFNPKFAYETFSLKRTGEFVVF